MDRLIFCGIGTTQICISGTLPTITLQFDVPIADISCPLITTVSGCCEGLALT